MPTHITHCHNFSILVKFFIEMLQRFGRFLFLISEKIQPGLVCITLALEIPYRFVSSRVYLIHQRIPQGGLIFKVRDSRQAPQERLAEKRIGYTVSGIAYEIRYAQLI